MLWILLGVSVVGLIIACIFYRWYDTEGFLIAFFMIMCISFVATPTVFAIYYNQKTTSGKQIAVLEERNNEVLEQIEPFVEQYLKYEKDSYKELKLNANTLVALSAYPELKGNEFIMKQIDIVLENQKQITRLKLDIAGLDAYKPWLFMGE